MKCNNGWEQKFAKKLPLSWDSGIIIHNASFKLLPPCLNLFLAFILRKYPGGVKSSYTLALGQELYLII